MSATRIYKVWLGFHIKLNCSISTISHHFWAFSHLFLHLKFSIWTIKTTWLSGIRIYKICVDSRVKIPYIPTISHLFWAFSHLFYTPCNFQSGPWKPLNWVLQKYMRFACFLYKNSSISTILHLFWAFSHLYFAPQKFQFRHKIPELKCYKNIYIYGLYGFSIENSFILAISHL